MAVLSERGQICALGVRSYDLPPVLNVKGFNLSYWVELMLSRPVVESLTAPVADWYFWNASVGPDIRCGQVVRQLGCRSPVARRTRVVPVSTIPAVKDRIVLPS